MRIIGTHSSHLFWVASSNNIGFFSYVVAQKHHCRFLCACTRKDTLVLLLNPKCLLLTPHPSASLPPSPAGEGLYKTKSLAFCSETAYISKAWPNAHRKLWASKKQLITVFMKRSPPSASRPSRVTQATVYDSRMDGKKVRKRSYLASKKSYTKQKASLFVARLHIFPRHDQMPIENCERVKNS